MKCNVTLKQIVLFEGVSNPSWIFEGVNTRGAGGGKPFTRGELGEGNFKGVGWVLSCSLSGDSSPRGGKFEGEWAFGESYSE